MQLSRQGFLRSGSAWLGRSQKDGLLLPRGVRLTRFKTIVPR